MNNSSNWNRIQQLRVAISRRSWDERNGSLSPLGSNCSRNLPPFRVESVERGSDRFRERSRPISSWPSVGLPATGRRHIACFLIRSVILLAESIVCDLRGPGIDSPGRRSSWGRLANGLIAARCIVFAFRGFASFDSVDRGLLDLFPVLPHRARRLMPFGVSGPQEIIHISVISCSSLVKVPVSHGGLNA